MVFRTVIIGAGPAGLTAAYGLAKQGERARRKELAEQKGLAEQGQPARSSAPSTTQSSSQTATAPSKEWAGPVHQAIVLEQSRHVGGRSRYETYQGYTFDLGAHRFTTQIPDVQALWEELLTSDLISVAGLSRIVYRDRFFDYPPAFTNALKQIGPIDTVLGAISYLAAQVQAQLFPPLDTNTAEKTAKHWLVSHFGSHLYHLFFESYVQKILGIPATEVHSDWVDSHLVEKSLPNTMAAALSRSSGTASTVFSYPLLGPGMLWERCRTRIEMLGSKVHTRAKVVHIERTGDRIDRVIVQQQAIQRQAVQKQRIQTQASRSTAKPNPLAPNTPARREITLSVIEADQFISSLPLADLIARLDPPAPPLVRTAARQLKHRSSIMVPLIIPAAELFPDATLYIHDPNLHVGRIQNFKNWSAAMVPEQDKTCLGLEYFCTEGDHLWRMRDDELVRLACQELVALELVLDTSWAENSATAATVIRQPKSHPLLTQDYYKPLAIVQDYLSTFENLQTVGNDGLHCDRTHDHSAFSGLLAARHIIENQSQSLSVRKRMVV